MNNRASFIDFCQGLLNMDPFQRWTPQQARLHPFITGEKWTKAWTVREFALRKNERVVLMLVIRHSHPELRNRRPPQPRRLRHLLLIPSGLTVDSCRLLRRAQALSAMLLLIISIWRNNRRTRLSSKRRPKRLRTCIGIRTCSNSRPSRRLLKARVARTTTIS